MMRERGLWVEGLVGRRLPAWNQAEQAATGKKANPPRPHPLPHLLNSAEAGAHGAAAAMAPDPHGATPGTLTSRYGFSFVPSRNALPLRSLICSLLVFVLVNDASLNSRSFI